MGHWKRYTAEPMTKNIAAIGECMAEIRPLGDPAQSSNASLEAALSYGGDTLNFAVYMARQGAAAAYVTALGDDPLSDWMLAQWRAEGVGCDLVRQEPGATPGLYLIRVDSAGERTFHYWRRRSPASRLLDDRRVAEALFDRLGDYPWLYLTGITLAIYAPDSRARLFAFLSTYRAGGGKVAFDTNFRPLLWTRRQAAPVCERMWRLTDLALPTLEDEVELFGDAGEAEVAARLQSWGVGEVVVKKGASGCMVADGAERIAVGASGVDEVADTTAAGDSFNAGYLAARLAGRSPRQAAARGNEVAAVVVRHPGAIVPAAQWAQALPTAAS